MNQRTKNMTALAVIAAIAYVLMLVGRFPFIPAVEFLKYDPKDVAIVIGGMIYGPFAAFMVSLSVSAVEMVTVSTTGPIGFFMNVLSTAAFACTAALIYKHKRTLRGAVMGLSAGVLLATGVMLLWNYIVTPGYYGIPRQAVVDMMLPGLLPFNLIKGSMNAALALMVYKPLVSALRKSHLLPEPQQEPSRGKLTLGVTLVSALILLTLVLLVLAIRGVV